MSVVTEGTLVHAAEYRTALIGNHALVIMLMNCGPGYSFEARLDYKQDHHRAKAVAATLGKGATVQVRSEGCFPRTDHGHAAIVHANVITATHADEGVLLYP